MARRPSGRERAEMDQCIYTTEQTMERGTGEQVSGEEEPVSWFYWWETQAGGIGGVWNDSRIRTCMHRRQDQMNERMNEQTETQNHDSSLLWVITTLTIRAQWSNLPLSCASCMHGWRQRCTACTPLWKRSHEKVRDNDEEGKQSNDWHNCSYPIC